MPWDFHASRISSARIGELPTMGVDAPAGVAVRKTTCPGFQPRGAGAPQRGGGVAPFRWTPNLLREKGVHDGKDKTKISNGVPRADGGAGASRPNAGVAVTGVRADGADDPRSDSSRRRSLDREDRGGASRTSNSPRWSGSGGSTITASWSRSAMFHRSNTRRRTTVASRISLNWRHSSPELSDKPGAVQWSS